MTQELSQSSFTVTLPTTYSKIQSCLPCQPLQVEYFPSSSLVTHWCFCTFSYKVKTPLKSSPQMLPLEVFYPVDQEWLAEPLTLVSRMVNRDTRYQIECSISANISFPATEPNFGKTMTSEQKRRWESCAQNITSQVSSLVPSRWDQEANVLGREKGRIKKEQQSSVTWTKKSWCLYIF